MAQGQDASADDGNPWIVTGPSPTKINMQIEQCTFGEQNEGTQLISILLEVNGVSLCYERFV